MKVLVTGGNGFLGQPIVEFLLKKNYEVVVLDIKKDNLKPYPGLTIILGSFEEKEKTDRATHGVDAIYHLALNFCEDLTEFFVSNIKGTINLLESAKKNKVKHFLYCSSSAVYGTKPPDHPVNETRPCYPENVDISKMPSGIPKGAKLGYGVLKLTLEKLCFAFGKNSGLPITVLRVIGGFGGKHNEVKPPGSEIIQKALKNEIIEVEEKSKTITTWVGDAAQAFSLATLNPKAFGEIFNVFSFSLSKRDLAEFIIKSVRSQSKIRVIPQKESGWQYDQSKIKTVLGYKPKAKPEDLKKFLENYIKSNQKTFEL